MALTLNSLQTQCGLMGWSGRFRSAESTRLEQPLARCVAEGDPLRHTSTILSALELCASATICTLPSRTQQLSSKSKYHKEFAVISLTPYCSADVANPEWMAQKWVDPHRRSANLE